MGARDDSRGQNWRAAIAGFPCDQASSDGHRPAFSRANGDELATTAPWAERKGYARVVSSSRAAVHVRTRDRAALLEAIQRRMSALGFVPLEAPTGREPVVRRLFLAPQGEWITLADGIDDAPDLS